jgi:hypothetical protein
MSRHARAHETSHFATIKESWSPSRNPGLTSVADWVEKVGFSEGSLRVPKTPASEIDGGQMQPSLPHGTGA